MDEMQLMAVATNGMSPETVGSIIAFIIAGLVGAGVLGKKAGQAQGKAEAQILGPQPFIVQMREEFATRRDLEKVENAMNSHISEMKGLIGGQSAEMKSLFREAVSTMTAQTQQTAKRIESQNERLTKKIEEVASGAYASRGKMHQTINFNAERLSKLEATSDVASQIEKLAEAIQPPVKGK